MKKYIKITTIGLILILFAACKQDELRVHFPASMPVFDSARVAENAIVYGDSITLSVGVSDPVTPLSTLEIKVVVNDIIIASETVRTKGNSSSYKKRYSVPFIAHMPNNAEVEVHLKSINVEGTEHDTILLNTIASRPAISSIWFVTRATATTVEIPLVDAQNYIYSIDNLSLGTEVSFRLSKKVTSTKKIDWTDTSNLVFGWVNNGLGLVGQDGSMITLTDPTIYGFKKITVDLFNFTVKGEGTKLAPVTELNISGFPSVQLSSTNHLNTSTVETWKRAQVYMGKDVEMTITGVTNLTNSLNPDFFEVTGTNKAKFLGETGLYTVYYHPGKNFVFVEIPAATYPDALWLCGVGFGPACTPLQKTSSWNWNTPLEYLYCRKVSTGVYQATFYAEHVIDPSAAEPWRLTFSAKFFHQKGWGGEQDARTYTFPNTLLTAPTTADLGNFVGTADLAAAPGIYRFTINVNTKTFTFVKIN